MTAERIISAIGRRIPPERVREIIAALPADSRARIAAGFAERPVRRKFKTIQK
jgi:hypothetical protein